MDAPAKGADFKSFKCVQRRVRTEWNVEPPTSKSIHQWDRPLKETRTLVSQTGKHPRVFVLEDIGDRVSDSFCRSPDKYIILASNDIAFCWNTPLYTRD
ncbi:uncharacterized protein TNCV_452211 [Trichonephila clavipes]|nr:uncharacterized protein TNCV_452211 [Trichonephila clavipes]